MKVKYQIFVSSTYQDLVEERDLVIKAILEMGHIPVGMEMFSAGDEEQWKLIQKQIDDCDYYIVIAAHRYGSVDSGISYTEKEYDYATLKSLPILGFVIQDGAEWPIQKSDTETGKKAKLTNFKEKIKIKIISYWSNKEDLYGKVSIALMKQFTTNPRIGWIKSSEAVGPEVLTEVTRLSKENSVLRDEIVTLKKQISHEQDEKFNQLRNTLFKHEIVISFFYKNGTKWEHSKTVNFSYLFRLIAPELMVDKSSTAIAHYIGIMMKPKNQRILRANYPTPSNTVSQILADLNVLDLVIPSTKRRSVHDTEQYWTLTEDGKTLYKIMRREKIDISEDDLPF